MVKQFHETSFDQPTLDKLALFEASFTRWLAVAANNKDFNGPIQIFDLFSGPGCDAGGIPGSPLIICKVIASFSKMLIENSKKIVLVFNDKCEKKIAELEAKLESYNFLEVPVDVQFHNSEFKDLIGGLIPRLKVEKSFNYVFLDQFGVDEVNDSLFKILYSIPRVDLLFFIAASFLTRFGTTKYFTSVGFIEAEKLRNLPSHELLRGIAGKFKKLVPKDKDYFMAPFSLKKGANVYGLIFGSSHIKGLIQFNEACWKVSKLTGNTNWVTKDEKHLESEQQSYFDNVNQTNRLSMFEKEMEKEILNKHLCDNLDIFYFTVIRGFKLKHAKDLWKKLHKAQKVVDVKPFPLNNDLWKKQEQPVKIALKS